MAGGLPRLERWYEGNVQKILSKNNAAKTLLATVGLFVLSFILMAVIPPKVVFFPDNQPNLANIYIEMPVGTDIEETNRETHWLRTHASGFCLPFRVTSVSSWVQVVGDGWRLRIFAFGCHDKLF